MRCHVQLQVMTQAGGDVKEEVWRAFIVLLTNAPELHAYAARSLYRALRDNLAAAELSLLATATWYIGTWALPKATFIEAHTLSRNTLVSIGSVVMRRRTVVLQRLASLQNGSRCPASHINCCPL